MPQPEATLTPLEVLCTVMRRRWEKGDEPGAVDIAKIAAPYMHPRCTAHPAGQAGLTPEQMTDAELRAAIAAAEARGGSAPDDPAGFDELG